jgi:hypothetical protein
MGRVELLAAAAAADTTVVAQVVKDPTGIAHQFPTVLLLVALVRPFTVEQASHLVQYQELQLETAVSQCL